MRHLPENPTEAQLQTFFADEAADKLQLQAQFEETLRNHTGPLTFEGYAALANQAGVPPETSSLPHQGGKLFRLYGTTALRLVFPEVTRVHVAVDHRTGSGTVLQPDALQRLPEQINGVPVLGILGAIANGVQYDAARETPDRIAAANGACTLVAIDGTRSLRRYYPELAPVSLGKRIEPAYRRTVPGEDRHPAVVPLSYGHTMLTIPHTGTAGPQELLIDPTIAQTDRTQDYDIEAAAVPAAQVAHYLRLRYSTYPEASVRTVNFPGTPR